MTISAAAGKPVAGATREKERGRDDRQVLRRGAAWDLGHRLFVPQGKQDCLCYWKATAKAAGRRPAVRAARAKAKEPTPRNSTGRKVRAGCPLCLRVNRRYERQRKRRNRRATLSAGWQERSVGGLGHGMPCPYREKTEKERAPRNSTGRKVRAGCPSFLRINRRHRVFPPDAKD